MENGDRSVRWIRWALACAVTAFIGYLGLFSWDRDHDVTGKSVVSYGTWQFVLLGLALIVVTRGAVYAHATAAPVLAIPPVLTICFWADWAQRDDSGLYMVGVVMLAVGSFLGTLAGVWMFRSLRDAHEDPRVAT